MTDDFLEAAYDLPKEAARKVIKALHLLAKNKHHPGLHWERLSGAGGLCSIRVDDNFRVILVDENPPVLIYVGPHDDAYRVANCKVLLPVSSHEALLDIDMQERVDFSGGTSREEPSRRMPVPLAEEHIEPFLLRTSKYFPLTRYLIRLREDVVAFAFTEIEKILAQPLPKSARKWPSWWANDCSHSQALAWIVAGYHSRNLQLAEERVDFQRA